MKAGAAGMSDGRAGDVARVERLLRVADRDGAVRLPELSAAEVYMLCDGSQTLVEDTEYAWWYGLTPDAREKLTKAAASLLGFRQLLRRPEAAREGGCPGGEPADDGVPLAMAPELSLIITARQQPAVLAVGTVSGDARAGTPRMYGLGGPDGCPQAIVAEQVTSQVTDPFGPLHKFVLLSPARAAETLATWACQPGQTREISIYRHRKGEPLTCDTAAVTYDAGTQTVARRRSGALPSPPVPHDRGSLVRLAAAMLDGDTP
jgi:hypothetical protein